MMRNQNVHFTEITKKLAVFKETLDTHDQICEGVPELKLSYAATELWCQKYLPSQILSTVTKLVQGSLINAPMRTRLDCAAVCSEEAKRLVMESSQIFMDHQGRREGPKFAKDHMMDVIVEPSVEVLDKIVRKEVEELQKAEQERIRAEMEKKSDLEVFNDMLFTDDQMYRVAQNLQPHMKADIDEQIAAWVETSHEINSAIEYVNKLRERGLADSDSDFNSDEDSQNSVSN